MEVRLWYPDDILDNDYGCVILCECLKRLSQKGDGKPYPPKALCLCGVLRYLRERQANPPNIKDIRFKELHNTCDFIFQLLHTQGI